MPFPTVVTVNPLTIIKGIFKNQNINDYLVPTGWPKEAIFTKPKSQIKIIFSVATGSYLLSFILSCVIYVGMICRKTIIWKNTIEPLDEDIFLSENPIPGRVASDFHMREPSNSISQSGNFTSDNLNIVDLENGNQEVEIENSHHDFDCFQSTEEPKDATESKVESNIGQDLLILTSTSSKTIQQQLQENKSRNSTVSLKSFGSVKSTVPDTQDSVMADSKRTVLMDLKQMNQNQSPNQQIIKNESLIIVEADIQCESNLSSFPAAIDMQGMSKMWSSPTKQMFLIEKSHCEFCCFEIQVLGLILIN